MTEPFYLTEGRGYWPDEEIDFWTCPRCGQTNSNDPHQKEATCSNCDLQVMWSERKELWRGE